MKKIYNYGFIIFISLNLLVGCSSDSTVKIEDKIDSNVTVGMVVDSTKYLSDIEYKINLNNDEIIDEIKYTNNENDLKLTINNFDYSLDDLYPDLTLNEFRIIDINKSDQTLEFVFSVASPPMDNVLSFYRYVENELIYLGNIMGSFEDFGNKIIFNDDDNIELIIDSYIMKEGNFKKLCSLNEQLKFKIVDSEYHEYIKPIESKVNKVIKVYSEYNIKTSIIEIPVDEKIVVIAEQNNWLKINWKEKEYWIDGNEIEHSPMENDYQFDGIAFWS